MDINLNKIIDLTSINWNTSKFGSSNGILSKAVVGDNFFKLGSYSKPFGFYGIEPLIELINSRIGEVLGFNVLHYELLNAVVKIDNQSINTLVSISKNYKKNGEMVISIERYYEQLSTGNNTYNFCIQEGFKKDIHKIFLYDYLICNMDRHGKNIEVIKSHSNTKLAPLFDNSLTFLTNRPPNDIKNKAYYNDEMAVNNFVGYRNLLQNLKLIDAPIKIKKLTKYDRTKVFQGLSRVTTREFRDYTWWLLNRRINDARLCNPRFILVEK